jgi:hypothetical protein
LQRFAGMRRWIAIAALAASGACASGTYAYVPVENVSGSVDGAPAAGYAIPAGRPEGVVRVTSHGVTRVRPEGGGHEVAVLHVRVILSNQEGGSPWIVDTRELVVRLAGNGTSRAAFVNSDVGEPPIIRLPAGHAATLDLYYPLPQGLERPQSLTGFALSWTVRTGAEIASGETPFGRLRLDPPPAYHGPAWVDVGIGFGRWPYWFHDPYYPWYSFRATPFIRYYRPYFFRRPIIVEPPPRRPLHIVRPPVPQSPRRR